MTEANDPNPRSLHEAAIDAQTEAQRAEFVRELAHLDAGEQAEGVRLLTDIGMFREALQAGDLPAGLEGKLLAIPHEIPQPRGWRKWMYQPVGWPHLAACAVLAIVISLGSYVMTQDSKPAAPQQLEARLASQVGNEALAVADAKDQSNGDADPAKVVASLPRDGLGFSPQLLRPNQSMQFAGGGTASFGGKPAVYTQWNAGKASYTLYQFDLQCLGLPANFIQTAAAVSKPNTQVNVWPGPNGACGWALVAVDAPPGNPFISAYGQ